MVSVYSVATSLFCSFTRNYEELKEVFGGRNELQVCALCFLRVLLLYDDRCASNKTAIILIDFDSVRAVFEGPEVSINGIVTNAVAGKHRKLVLVDSDEVISDLHFQPEVGSAAVGDHHILEMNIPALNCNSKACLVRLFCC